MHYILLLYKGEGRFLFISITLFKHHYHYNAYLVTYLVDRIVFDYFRACQTQNFLLYIFLQYKLPERLMTRLLERQNMVSA